MIPTFSKLVAPSSAVKSSPYFYSTGAYSASGLLPSPNFRS